MTDNDATSAQIKAGVRARFGQYAQNYVTSDVHAQGNDLDRLIEIANLRPDWIALDVATGGGHTALKAAPNVRRMVASDFGLNMLEAARAHHESINAPNLVYCAADGERLPFADESFDVVLCRYAIHHFPDAYRFMLDAARVLKRGGYLVIQDHLLPPDPRAMAYIEAFDRLRDPTHQRAFNEDEWRGLFLDANFEITHVERDDRAALLLPWAERQGCSPEVTQHLQIMLAQAPDAVAEWIQPRSVLSPDAGFNHVSILISGRR